MARAGRGRLTLPAAAIAGSLAIHVALATAFAPRLAAFATLHGNASLAVAPEDVVSVEPPVRGSRHADRPSVNARIASRLPALARFDAEMRGRRALLRRGQGYYAPVASWHVGGARYYRVAYAFVYADGTYESGLVPWPVTFPAGSDPFARGVGRATVALPAPPPDYLPPGTLGKALRAYFPHLSFED